MEKHVAHQNKNPIDITVDYTNYEKEGTFRSPRHTETGRHFGSPRQTETGRPFVSPRQTETGRLDTNLTTDNRLDI